MNRSILSSILGRTSSTCRTFQPSRNTMIFRRMYPVPLYNDKRTGPFRPKLRRREYVYIMEENTIHKPAGNMDVILATDVEGLGLKGDVVNVKKGLARTHMLPVGVAEYVNPENLAKYQQIREEKVNLPRQSMTAMKTIKEMSAMSLPIPMSSTVPWQLSTTHVKVAFRIAGVELKEDCIKLPEEPVTKPGEIALQITVNGMDKVTVKAIVYQYSRTVAASLPPVWSKDVAVTQFNIEEVIAQAARRMRGLTVQNNDNLSASARQI